MIVNITNHCQYWQVLKESLLSIKLLYHLKKITLCREYCLKSQMSVSLGSICLPMCTLLTSAKASLVPYTHHLQ